MKIPTDPKEKEQLLNQLRMAVAFQIKLWDSLRSLCEAIDGAYDQVAACVNAMALVANDGMELGDADLEELLDTADPGRIVVGKALDERPRQIH